METKTCPCPFAIIAAVLLLLIFGATSYAGPLGNWNLRPTIAQGNILRHIAYGNGIFVTVGAGGVILTSTDGSSWENRSSGTTEDLIELTFGNGTFVVLGETGSIIISTDGETWTKTASLIDSSVAESGIAFGNGTFVVAVTTTPRVLCSESVINFYTSHNGITWTASSTVNQCQISSATFGNGTFVAAACGNCNATNEERYGRVLTSTDGLSWDQHLAPAAEFVHYVNGHYISVGYQPPFGGIRRDLQISPDGTTWSTAGILHHSISAVASGNGTYVAVGGGMSISQDGIIWEENLIHSFTHLAGVAFGASVFVAVGSNGLIIKSSDGFTWSTVNAGRRPLYAPLNQIASGESLLIGVGDFGTIVTSQDGKQWTDRTLMQPEWSKIVQPRTLAFGNNVFVAGGHLSKIAVSSDGVSWSVVNLGGELSFNNVAFGNGIFVATGNPLYPGDCVVATSSDGFHWTLRPSRLCGIVDLIFDNGFFAAVSSGWVYTSSDGISWTTGHTAWPYIQEIAYGNGLFMAAGYFRDEDCWGQMVLCQYGGVVQTSPDGISWTVQVEVSRRIGSPNGLCFGNGMFISAWGDQIYATPDGRNWQGASLDIQGNILGFVNGRFLARNGYGTILSSTDGLSWNDTYSSGDSFGMVAFGNDIFIAVGEGGTTLTSDDGSRWTLIRQGKVTKDLKDVTYGNGNFVSVGEMGFIFTSPDAMDWSEQQSGTTADLNAVTFGNGRLVAAGGQGTILVSSDARTWSSVPSGTTELLRGAAFGNDIFVVCGNSGTILSTGDGLSWTPATLDLASSGSGLNSDSIRLSGVAYGNGLFVSVGSSGTIFTSPDGRTWTIRSSHLGFDFIDIHFDRGIFVAIGNTTYTHKSLLMSSMDGINWSAEPMEVNPLLSVASVGDTFIVLGGEDGKTILQSDPVLSRECIPFLTVASSTGTLPVSQDGSFASTGAEPFSVSVGLWTVQAAGIDADWWMLANTPFGWFYYVHPGQWYPLFSIENAQPAYQGPLFQMGSLPVPIPAVLPAGRYTFYFGVDLLMNGVLDSSPLYYDHVTVDVGPAD